jgi:uncharacterized protein
LIAEILSLGAPGGPTGTVLLWLGVFALCAGFVDAVVGGGGLIQVPALFSLVPQASTASLFGTNKLASVAGTSMSAWRYVRAVKLPWNMLLPALIAAAIFSWLGAATVSLLPRAWAQPLVLIMLIVVGVVTFTKKEMGLHHQPRLGKKYQRIGGFLVGALLGFYDGFFGPGTGAFLIFVFVRGFGYDFLHASASAKMVNVMTNLAALLFFVPAGEFFILAALLMASCNAAGAFMGTHIAVKKGSRFVRHFFLFLISVLIIRMALSTMEMF